MSFFFVSICHEKSEQKEKIDATRPNGIALVWNPQKAKVGPFSIRLKLFFTSAYKAIQYVLGGVV